MQHQISPNDRETSLIGTLLGGRWLVHGELGAGGMGRVYSAIHQHNGRRVAIKVLNPAIAHNPEVRERFYQEAYAANLVVHPGTVAALDDGCLEDGTPYLVMELLSGRDLEGLFNDAGPLDEGYVVSLSIELLSILESAHEAGVLHRDIKPENIFCTSDGKIKLLDFGIAKVSESQRTHHTQCGATIGTPAYMPPEQARGKWDELDARSDLWSVGATMFTLLSGRLVHSGSTVNELLLSAMTQRPSPLNSVAPHVSTEVAQVVDRAIQFEQMDRYSSAREMRDALILALNQGRSAPPALRVTSVSAPRHATPSSPRTTHQPVISSEMALAMPPSHSKRNWAMAAMVTTLCAGVLAAFYFPTEEHSGLAGARLNELSPPSEDRTTALEVIEAGRAATFVEMPALDREKREELAESQISTPKEQHDRLNPDPERTDKNLITTSNASFNSRKSTQRTTVATGSSAQLDSIVDTTETAHIEAAFDPLALRR